MLEGVNRIGMHEWEVPVGYVAGMRVPGRFFLSESLGKTLEPGAIQQLANVATLPGILKNSLAMPDIHWGYGFPIGGVAAFSVDDGIISPGGVGFDINCGVRLLATPLLYKDVAGRRDLIDELFRYGSNRCRCKGCTEGLSQGTRRYDDKRCPMGGQSRIW